MLARLVPSSASVSLALTRARLHAWWEGKDFDAKKLLAEQAAAQRRIAAEEARQDPRLLALAALWGAGRISPFGAGDEGEWLEDLSLESQDLLGIVGLGSEEGFRSLLERHPGPIIGYEWRKQPRLAVSSLVDDFMAEDAPRFACEAFDPEFSTLPKDGVAGLLVFETLAFTYDSSRFLKTIAQAIAPGGAVLLVDYLKTTGTIRPSAFASAWAEANLQSLDALKAGLEGHGLRITKSQDVTKTLISQVKERLSTIEPEIAHFIQTTNQRGAGIAPVHELFWEIETWRARLSALQSGALSANIVLAKRS